MKTAIRPSTREAIIDAAIATLAENPGASTSEIAMRAGVGRATLHRHFRKREDLILALQKQSLNETNQAVIDKINDSMTAAEKLQAMFEAIIPLGDRYHFLFNETTSDTETRSDYGYQLKWLNALVDELKTEQVVAADVPNSWAVAQLDQLIWTAWWEVACGRVAAADAPLLALRTFTGGLEP